MVAVRSHPFASRRPGGLLLVASALLAGVVLRPQRAFVPTGGSVPAAASIDRRGALLAAVTGASLAAASAKPMPALAANVVENLLISGAPESWDALNGQYTLMPGKSINERGVYKRDDDEYYLMQNNCGAFQISKELDGACNGVAIEKKGNWRIGQLAVRNFKVKPVKKDTAEAVEVKVGQTEAEKDMQLLQGNEGINVGQYIKAKGGTDYLANVLQLEEGDDKIADGLAAKLGSITYTPGKAGSTEKLPSKR